MLITIGASSDFFDEAFYDSNGDVAVELVGTPTSTEFVIQNTATGHTTTVTGTNFSFSNDGEPLSGTITGMEFGWRVEGVIGATLSQISWSLVDFNNALGDVQAIADLINAAPSLTIDASSGISNLNLQGNWDGILPFLTLPMNIIGSDKDDLLQGSVGNDTIDPGANDNSDYSYDDIEGTIGNDVIDLSNVTAPYSFVHLDYENINGALTFDLDGNANTGSISGPGFTDTILDPRQAMRADGLGLEGSEFDDVFNITKGVDDWVNVQGNEGNDTYNLMIEGTMRLSFNYGADQAPFTGLVLNMSTGVVSNDGLGFTDQINILGNNGRVEIRGTDHVDTMIGSDGRESFITERGDDYVDGGLGYDRVRYDRSGVDYVNVDLLGETASGIWDGLAFTDTLVDIEWIRGSRYGNDTLAGDDEGNTLQAYSGNDFLDGRGGADELYSGYGADTLNGRDGNDTLEGGADGDVLRGNDDDDFLNAGSGDDFANGGKQHDEVNGGDGNDTLEGANGMDTIRGEGGFDLIFGGRSNDVISGGSGDDTVRGNEGKDELFGDLGNDSVMGGNQDDTLRGSFGNDTLLGQNGFDQISGDDGDDWIDGGNAGDTIDGGAGNDWIRGSDGKDELYGGADNDTLNGGQLDDTLTGGSGLDVFVFTGGWGQDVVTDFSSDDGEKIDFTSMNKITDFTDLVTNHLRDNGGTAEIYFASNTLLLEGVTVAEIGTGLAYSEDDFLF